MGEMSMTASVWLRMCSAMRCSREWTTGISRCPTLGWAKRMSNLVSVSPPGSVLVSATRTYGALTARWSRLKLSTFIFLTASMMRDVVGACRRHLLWTTTPRVVPRHARASRFSRRFPACCPPAVDDTPQTPVHTLWERPERPMSVVGGTLVVLGQPAGPRASTLRPQAGGRSCTARPTPCGRHAQDDAPTQDLGVVPKVDR